nr:uncharacterized protein LOC112941825 [Solanum lycopersicum]
MLLSEFDIVYVTQKAIKAQALADHLAENPVDEEYEPLRTYFHDEEVSFVGEDISEAYPGWRLFFDGAENHQGRGVGAVLVSESGQHYPMAAKLRFNCINNMAEYEACVLVRAKSVQNLCKRFRKIDFRHTPRIQNELADTLATIASMIKHPDTDYIDPLDIDLKEHPVHCSHVESEPDGFPWYFDIKRRTPDLGLLRCVDAAEAVRLIEQIHAGVCVHGDLIRVAPHELNAMSSPWSFVAWGMDVIGPIEPAVSNGFGVPESIITDNGVNLNSHLMKEICEQFKIIHRRSTAYRPQMNGAVEAANKNIKKILKKMIDKQRGWHEMLPYTLLGYRTKVRTSVGATPYLLVYGTEAVIPVEVEIPSLRIIQEAELSNAEWVSKRTDQLALIDKKRMVAVCHGQLYRQRMTRAFHKRVRARNFEVGQLVLKRIFPHQDEHKGMFAPNWQGPYMVRKVLSGGALVLSEMDGAVWPKPINSDAIKRYYA